jgi:hypothetical protein
LFTAALEAREIKEKLVSLGIFPDGTFEAEFGAFLRNQYGDYGRVFASGPASDSGQIQISAAVAANMSWKRQPTEHDHQLTYKTICGHDAQRSRGRFHKDRTFT